jgi:demethylmenaquinone methyltransferase/2-methoxy-6-polyprenyl-1,4-benzoquinol methylase
MDSTLQQQIDYYRARAGEYDQWFYRQGRYDRGPEINRRWFAEAETVVQALDRFRPTGSVLELACGTGIWTEQLLRHATELTAVDASPEALEIHRQKLQSSKVTYVEADLFTWKPDRQYDVVFFGFWLSHVPPSRFGEFWALVDRALVPDGRFFLVDSADPTPATPSVQVDEHRSLRTLADGRQFEVVKRWYEPAGLARDLLELGWSASVGTTANGMMLVASGQRNLTVT